jgi:hypothetical protein
MTATAQVRLTAIFAALAMALTLMAAPASAQTQEGLVNVNVSDVTVQIPIGIAANVCDVNANILAEQLRRGGAQCDASTDSDAVFVADENGEAPTQEGLVNVNVSNLVIQLPVAVAANICDVNVNVLARQLRRGGAACTAVADAGADA